MKIASKIASDFMNEKEAFDMTEREWLIYRDKHPKADPANHHIIPVPGKSYKESNHREYMKRERRAKRKYFKKMKKLHPNYVPMIKKDEFMDIIMNGEYSCISADLNPNDERDKERCQDPQYVQKRREFLRKELDKLGVKYTEVVGCYKGFEEPTFLITHDLSGKVLQRDKDNTFLVLRNGVSYETDADIIKELNRIGADCNQDSVTHSQGGIMEWHYTTGENAGDRIVCGPKTDIIKPDSNEEYFSKGRISKGSYTMWSADTSNAYEDMGDGNFRFKQENLKSNPYF